MQRAAACRRKQLHGFHLRRRGVLFITGGFHCSRVVVTAGVLGGWKFRGRVRVYIRVSIHGFIQRAGPLRRRGGTPGARTPVHLHRKQRELHAQQLLQWFLVQHRNRAL